MNKFANTGEPTMAAKVKKSTLEKDKPAPKAKAAPKPKAAPKAKAAPAPKPAPKAESEKKSPPKSGSTFSEETPDLFEEALKGLQDQFNKRIKPAIETAVPILLGAVAIAQAQAEDLGQKVSESVTDARNKIKEAASESPTKAAFIAGAAGAAGAAVAGAVLKRLFNRR